VVRPTRVTGTAAAVAGAPREATEFGEEPETGCPPE
jgi:hypothetical protein